MDRITESVILHYTSDLRERGRYILYANDKSNSMNYPVRRRDYRAKEFLTNEEFKRLLSQLDKS